MRGRLPALRVRLRLVEQNNRHLENRVADLEARLTEMKEERVSGARQRPALLKRPERRPRNLHLIGPVRNTEIRRKRSCHCRLARHELPPVENIWQFIRDNWLSNRVFASYDDIVARCCEAWMGHASRLSSIGVRGMAHRSSAALVGITCPWVRP